MTPSPKPDHHTWGRHSCLRNAAHPSMNCARTAATPPVSTGALARARSALDCGRSATALPTSTPSRTNHAPSGQNRSRVWGSHSCEFAADPQIQTERAPTALGYALRKHNLSSIYCARTQVILDCGSAATALPQAATSLRRSLANYRPLSSAPVTAGQRSGLTRQPWTLSPGPVAPHSIISNRSARRFETHRTPALSSNVPVLIDTNAGTPNPLVTTSRPNITRPISPPEIRSAARAHAR
jgi:hypothetical protein